MLDAFALNGSSFLNIVHKMWEQFGHRVESQAVQRDGRAFVLNKQTGQELRPKFLFAKLCQNLKNIGVLASKELQSRHKSTFFTYCVPHIPKSDNDYRNLTRSAQMALDGENGALADYEELRQDWNAFGQRLDSHKLNLE
ncbi:hypothetical protein PHMEG_00021683 [Phytophthora megakarya]|uniref:Uncharacterized protein n=1 Tax=Phytophthora megakarya TaxID=4795 RepID=A0A225VNJ8_9STRA|nr:hypothetical protein PHMEG_00021683 [Phytophthora megakarya]